jgi:hypothetical protein
MINSRWQSASRSAVSGWLGLLTRPWHSNFRLRTDLSRRTIVCPCHDATLYDLRSCWTAGFRHPETLKRATAVLMGPCQGKYCAPLVSTILTDLASETSHEEGTGAARRARPLQRRPSARPPLYPVRLGDLAAPFQTVGAEPTDMASGGAFSGTADAGEEAL